MTSSVQWILATVLAVQGASIKLDKGMLEGLRPGDRGFLYYDLSVEARTVRIEAGQAEITSCEQLSCTAALVDGAKARIGLSFRAEVASQRTSAAELLRLGNLRLSESRFDLAKGYFASLVELMPDDRLAARRLQHIENRLETEQWQAQERGRVEFYRLAANQSFEDGDLRAVRGYVEKVLRVTPDDKEMVDLGRQVARRELELRMLQIPAGTYPIGLPRTEASFYNQQPRFQVKLPDLMVDRRPLTASDVGHLRDSASDYLTEVNFAAAREHCENLGMRLPTEFEWEIAAAHPEFQPVESISEWTTSWYQPYPGNRRVEDAYGKDFKVLRGSDAAGQFDPKARYFMDPAKSAADVGFRCAREIVDGSP